MNQDPTSKEEEVLVCPDCGRVNPLVDLPTRSSGIRCSGCGCLLRAERTRGSSIVTCPACQSGQEVDFAWAGRQITCGSCGNGFVLQVEWQGPPVARSGAAVSSPIKKRPSRRAAASPSTTSPLETAPAPPEPDPSAGESDQEQKKSFRTRKRKKKRTFNRLKEIAKILFLSGLVISAIIWYIARSTPKATSPAASPAGAPPIAADSPPGKAAPIPQLEQKESELVSRSLADFLSAPSYEQMLGVARFPSSVGQRMRHYYETHSPLRLALKGISKTRETVVDGRLFLLCSLHTAEGKEFPVVVERATPGKFLVDWDSFVRFESTDWNLFAARRPPDDPQRFQLFVKRDDTGNPHYPLEDFNAFLVFWKDTSDGLPMFVRRGSLEEQTLLEATDHRRKTPPQEPTTPATGIAPMTLEVVFRPAANAENQPAALELKSLVHDGWVDTRPGNE